MIHLATTADLSEILSVYARCESRGILKNGQSRRRQ